MKDNQDFLDFQQYFKEYQARFGLNGFTTYFKYEPLANCFASLNTLFPEMMATVRLSSKISAKERPCFNVKKHAKHEAIHLLISKLADTAYNRFVHKEQIYAAEEELSVKLEGLISD